jgi:hypothetical protein
VHGLAVLVAIEAMLVGSLYVCLRGDWHRTCLYCIAITAPLEVYRTTLRDLNPSLFRLSIGLAVVTLLFDLAREGSSSRAKPRPQFSLAGAYLFLTGVVAISLTQSGSFLGKRLLGVVLVGVLVILVVAELARRTPREDLARALVFGSVLPILAGCWQVLAPELSLRPALPLLSDLPVGDGLEGARSEVAVLSEHQTVAAAIRMKGTFVDPNHFGTYLVFVLLVAIGLAAHSLGRPRSGGSVAFAALAAAALATLVGTYSRSAWAAAIVAAVGAILMAVPRLRRRPPVKRVVALTCGAAAAGSFLILLLAPTVAERLSPASALNSASDALHKRHAQAGFDAFRSDPVFGIGSGALGPRLNEGVRTSAADSTYLTVMAELGAVGLFALLLTAGVAVQLLWRRYRAPGPPAAALLPAALLAAYAGFLLANVVYDQLWWRDFHFASVGGRRKSALSLRCFTSRPCPPSGSGSLCSISWKPMFFCLGATGRRMY